MRTNSVRTVLVACVVVALAGCITGQALYLPGGLSRPPQKERPPAPSGPAVAVLDFGQAPSVTDELGRDYDHVRSIRWRGTPGKTMADLVAAALAEKGCRVVRAADDAAAPADATSRVRGRVEEFRVDARRVRALKSESAARVSLTVSGDGPGAPAGWSAAVSSEYAGEDPFVTPEGVRDAMGGAANLAADEAVRRLVAGGIVSVPPAPGAAPAP